MRDYAAIAKQYALDVVKGKVPAGRLVQLACVRHLDELRDQQRKDFPYRFDESKASKVCAFVELMPHVKGKWAKGEQLIVLEPWQVFILATIFGWVRKSDELRRFRKAYIEVPRKNAKSTLAAAIGLYMLAADGEHGAEVYSGATSEKQAYEVFRPAREMAKKSPRFIEAFGVEVMTSNLSIPANGSRFEPVIGKPGDGASPSCAIVDEFHEHDSDELYDTMLTGMGAREQPLIFVITTAGADIAGPCYALREDVVGMLEGTIAADDLFGIIYTIDLGTDDEPGDDWTTESALRKANPNYDVSVSGDFLAGQVRDAINSARKQSVVKTKHLNVWVSARSAWMNMELWNALADTKLDPEQFAGEPCWLAVDLASKVDVASVIKIFRRDQDGLAHWYFFGRHYLPEERVLDEERRHYQGWVANGHLIATPGDVIDYDRIREDILEDAELHRIVQLGYDPWGATQLAMQLQDAGVDVLEIPQTVTHLSEPMKEVEAMVIAGRMHHDGNPAMNWMMSNVTARVDAKDNVFPRKEKGEKKIDGPVALINAMCVAMRPTEEKPKPRVRTLA